VVLLRLQVNLHSARTFSWLCGTMRLCRCGLYAAPGAAWLVVPGRARQPASCPERPVRGPPGKDTAGSPKKAGRVAIVGEMYLPAGKTPIPKALLGRPWAIPERLQDTSRASSGGFFAFTGDSPASPGCCTPGFHPGSGSFWGGRHPRPPVTFLVRARKITKRARPRLRLFVPRPGGFANSPRLGVGTRTANPLIRARAGLRRWDCMHAHECIRVAVLSGHFVASITEHAKRADWTATP